MLIEKGQQGFYLEKVVKLLDFDSIALKAFYNAY